MVISTEQLKQFERDGFLVIPEFFSVEQAQVLKDRADELLRDFSLEDHPMTQFRTGDGDGEHVGDDYFLGSGDKIRFFFEKDAFVDGKLATTKEQSINKIGHALHVLDPVFETFSLTKEMADITKDLGFQSPLMIQSMVIFKQPRIGGAVPPHQDSSFLYTEPLSATGFWFALEDCTPDNGCLSFIPGSHKDTPIRRRFVRNPLGGTKFIGDEHLEVDDTKFVNVEIPTGTLVLIHGNVVHKSAPNLSSKSRYAYTFHVIEGTAHYPADNWLQPTPQHPFTKVKPKREEQ